jgi:beta propeller repeat protein
MKKITLLLLLYLCTQLAFPVSISPAFPIGNHSASQMRPAISGDIIVWEDARNGLRDIYGYDLSTSTEFPICTNWEFQYNPAVSGDIVVWEDERNKLGRWDTYGYDLSTSTEFPIHIGPADSAADYPRPVVSGDIVVWCYERNGNYDIYGYDLNTSTEFPICTDAANQYFPAISGDIVVWQDNYHIYGISINCTSKPQSDANDDCVVDMQDFAIMASEWLDCGWSEPSACL